MKMEKLFMLAIGGSIHPATIEVHDIQFVKAEIVEEAFDAVRSRWYGEPTSLHVDSYKVLKEIDGYSLTIGETSDKKLFFINYGGYAKDIFVELHLSTFVLATNITEAEALANDKMKNFENMSHIDSITDVVDSMDSELTLGFSEGDYKFLDVPDWQGYISLG